MHRLIAIVATLLLSASALAHAPRASVGALPFGEPTQARRIEADAAHIERQAEAASPEPHALENASRQQKTAHRAHARLKHAESARVGALTHCLVLEKWFLAENCALGRVELGHTGYLKDPLLDQLYAQARQYTPGLGRFTSVDPWTGDAMNPVTLNKYLAFNGNPGSLVDPDGRCAGPILFVCLGVLGAELGFFGSVISQEVIEGKNLATVDYGRAGVEGVVGGVSGATGGALGLGARVGFAVAGGVATDTILSTGVDAAYTPSDQFVMHESLATNAAIGTASVAAGALGGVVIDSAKPMVSRWWSGSSSPPLIEIPSAPTLSPSMSSAELDASLNGLQPEVGATVVANLTEGGGGNVVAVPQILLNKAAGDGMRDVIAASRPGSTIEQNFGVTGGLRRVDILDGTTAIESKVGRTSLGKRERQELARDIKLLRSGQVESVEWHFSPSPTTGKSGPTAQLRTKLEKHGIKIVE